MVLDARKNLAKAIVAVAPSPALSGTSLTFVVGGAAAMPTPPYNMPVYPPNVEQTTANTEFVRVTGQVGEVATILRAQESSAARAILVGDVCSAPPTKKTFDDIDTLFAPLASPALTGTPTAPTAAALTNTTQIASTAFVEGEVATEVAARTAAVALKAPLASPALTGTPTAPTQGTYDNSTNLATTAYAQLQASQQITAAFVSPALTGVPTAPTAAPGTVSTQLATTAFISNTVLSTAQPMGGASDATTGTEAGVAVAGASLIRFTNTGALTVQGFLPGVDGQRLNIRVNGSGSVTLSNQNVSATAVNRIITGTGASIVLQTSGWAHLVYDVATARWLVSAYSMDGIAPANQAAAIVAAVAVLQPMVEVSYVGGSVIIADVTLGISTILYTNIAPMALKGLQAGVSGQRLNIRAGGFQITLSDNDVAAVAANRFSLDVAGGVMVLQLNGWVNLIYSGYSSRWLAFDYSLDGVSPGNQVAYVAAAAIPVGLFTMCVVYNSTTQSIPNATFQAITLDTEDVDYNNMHSPSTNPSRITPGVAGYYTAHGRVGFAASAAGTERIVTLRMNGSTYRASVYMPPSAIANVIEVHMPPTLFGATDYLELVVYQDTGGALIAGSAGVRYTANEFSVQRQS